ncbi:MAG: hypothetical protein CMC63_09955 [Flavobacteriaceae bacterium]|nr:hypothetical protein [Flavobacteriaceae bacterium]|tara:strand:+ start:859 stop:1215 length:357 start_codon:yes stop_codon:yes gene_type:complete
MSNKLHNKEDQMDHLFEGMKIRFDKSKDTVWEEIFEDTIKSENPNSKIIPLNWTWTIAASVLLLVALNFFYSNQISETNISDDSIALEQSSIVESLLIEDQELDIYFDEYLLNAITDE